jgi:CRISPR-associated protein Cas2
MKPSTPPQIPHSHAQRWLLAYDIRDPKRLQRVSRYINKEALRLQFSVYVLKGNREQIEQVMAQLRQLIDEKADDVRIYPLTENTRIWGMGTQFADGGNTLSDAYLDRIIQPEPGEPAEAQASKRLSF